MKLPEGIEEEWEEDYEDHHPDGHIQFANGTVQATPVQTNSLSFLFHFVYPFYRNRSFSMNMNFLEVPKEKSVDK